MTTSAPGTECDLTEACRSSNLRGRRRAGTCARGGIGGWVGRCTRGGCTKMDWGNPPREREVVLSTKELDRLLEHAAGDCRRTVEAGCTIEQLQHQLALRGQRLAHRPALAGAAPPSGRPSACPKTTTVSFRAPSLVPPRPHPRRHRRPPRRHLGNAAAARSSKRRATGPDQADGRRPRTLGVITEATFASTGARPRRRSSSCAGLRGANRMVLECRIRRWQTVGSSSARDPLAAVFVSTGSRLAEAVEAQRRQVLWDLATVTAVMRRARDRIGTSASGYFRNSRRRPCVQGILPARGMAYWCEALSRIARARSPSGGAAVPRRRRRGMVSHLHAGPDAVIESSRVSARVRRRAGRVARHHEVPGGSKATHRRLGRRWRRTAAHAADQAGVRPRWLPQPRPVRRRNLNHDAPAPGHLRPPPPAFGRLISMVHGLRLPTCPTTPLGQGWPPRGQFTS